MSLIIDSIKKSYGKKEVLKNITFSAEYGECIGLLGLNGSGKSTFFNVLSGICRCDGGSFRLDEIDLLSDKKSSILKALENENVQAGIKAFWEKNISVDEEKLIFFISFGINDYAVGRPVYNDSMDEYCYVGALKNGIDRLQEAYPKSKIVLMTPNYVEIFEHGTLDNSGKGFVFTDFVEAAKELAAQEQLQLVDVFGKLGITAENTSAYLADGCHPSYYGRYKIGELIWKSLMLQ